VQILTENNQIVFIEFETKAHLILKAAVNTKWKEGSKDKE
jgi:hypothetical protein